MNGVIIIPYKNIGLSYTEIEDKYWIIGQELKDGKIKLIQNGYFTHIDGAILNREEFDEKYFTEAL